MQSQGATGQLEESCRAERKPLGETVSPEPRDEADAPLPLRQRKRAVPREGGVPERRGGFSADVLVNGGVMGLFAGSAAAGLPQITGYVALGGRGASGTGFVGVLNASLGFVTFGSLLVIGVAPGLRLGKASHAIFSLGPTLLTGGFGGQRATGLAGSAIVQSVINLTHGFVLTPQAGLHFDTSGVLLTLGIGFGFSTL